MLKYYYYHTTTTMMTMIDDDDGGEGGVMINNTNLMMKGYNVAKCLPTQSTRSFVQQLKIMSATALKDLAKKLPKTEVHLHLDGSLSAEFICKRAKVRNIKLGVDKSNLRTFLHSRKQVQIADGNKQKIKGNWGIFDFCNQFLQTKEELVEATTDLLHRCAKENVRCCEIRFCPTLHTLEGLSERDAVQSVINGYIKAKETIDIEGGVIVCALRSYPKEHAIKMAQIASEFLKYTPGVVGYDIAGDEGSYGLELMMDGVREANRLNVPVTVHA